MPTHKKKREGWASTLGFILATSGAAIGLGNIQRFPYLVAHSGGAPFVFVYLLFILLLGIPLILVEFSIGRFTQKNPVGAIETIKPKSSWKLVGYLAILTAFFILSYYSVIGGWTLGYCVEMLFNMQTNLQDFASNPVYVLGYTALFLCLTMLIVMKGIKKGIERYSKIFMPILLIILIVLVVRSLSLPNSMEGVLFYLKPDFSELTTETILLALGQAFFSLSIGEAVLVTYGSYTRKKENLFSSSLKIAGFDTAVALLAGLIIFPAIFSFHEPVDQGVGLSFEILPKVFSQMPFGNIFGLLFFLLLAFAALTTAIALLEMPVMYLIDTKKMSRKKAVWIMGSLAFLFSFPSALSHGANSFFSQMTITKLHISGFYNIMDFFWGSLGMVIGGGLLAIFTGWVWKAKNASNEILIGCAGFKKMENIWIFLVRYFCPIAIIIILLNIFSLK